MDIDLLSKMVYDLILEHDRVALPGVGCFVAETVPASFSDRGYTINPPYRKLSFRSRPDDGELLVNLYSRSNGVSVEDARAILTDFLSEMREVLFSRKVIVFPGLGRLRATRENNLFFVADENLDICPEGFGLQPLSLKTRRETVQEIADKVSELDCILNPEQPAGEKAPEEPSAAPVPEDSPVKEPLPDKPAASEAVEEAFEAAGNEEAPGPATAGGLEEAFHEDVSETSRASAEIPSRGNSRRTALMAVLAIVLTVAVLTVAVLLAAFMLVARLCPDFMDSLLYTREELDIINYNL